MPDRPIIDVFDTSGELRARIGDISGRPWGGAGFVLPEGTYGLWTDREGAWLRGNVTMFYANSQSLTRTGGFTVNSTPPGPHRITLTLDETFPFGSMRIPAGRIITMEMFLHSLSGSVSSPGVVFANFITKLNAFKFRGSRAGAAEQDFDFLSGPTTGDVLYSSLKLRLIYHIQFTHDISFNQTLSWSVTRVASIRMFAHEVHAITTMTVTSEVYVDGGAAAGLDKGSLVGDSGTDQGGGAGTDVVAAPGDAPGGPFV